MPSLSDHQWGYKRESGYGTPVVVDRFHEILADGSAPSWDPQPYQGRGLRPARSFPYASRRKLGYGQGEPSVKMEIPTVGGLDLLAACLGSGSVAQVGGAESTTYQFLASSALSDNVLPSVTMQYGIVDTPASGEASNPFTFAGCTCSQLEIECPSNGALTMAATFDALSRADETALASASYEADVDYFFSWTGAVYLGTPITVPTATALASGGSSVASVLSWKVTVNNGIRTDGWRVGGRRQPRVQAREITLEADICYDDSTIVDAARDQTALGIILTSEAGALSTGLETFQVVLPCFFVDDGGLPEPTEGEETVTKIKATCLIDDGATPDTEPLYIAQRTSDTSL